MSAQAAAGPETAHISSSKSPSEAADDSESVSILEEAIASATGPRVKQVLLNICKKNAICRHLASDELLVSTDYAIPAIANGSSKKRVRNAYEVCCQCHTSYNVLVNETTEDTCRYHPGKSGSRLKGQQ
jgi:hypothetical protein